MRTSLPPAAARAVSSASAGDASMKWNVVPPSIEMEGGTTFHFLDASPAEALRTAREAAGGKDVRIGGGPTVIREFLAAGLVDHMHAVVVPILLGRGVRLWDGLEGLEQDYRVEATSSSSGVTHVTFTRAA